MVFMVHFTSDKNTTSGRRTNRNLLNSPLRMQRRNPFRFQAMTRVFMIGPGAQVVSVHLSIPASEIPSLSPAVSGSILSRTVCQSTGSNGKDCKAMLVFKIQSFSVRRTLSLNSGPSVWATVAMAASACVPRAATIRVSAPREADTSFFAWCSPPADARCHNGRYRVLCLL